MKRFLFTASQVAVAAFLTLAAAQCTFVRADEIYDWSNTAANNNNAPPDGFPENMNYSEVNDAARELMAVVKRYVEATNGTNTTAGTQPAYTLTSGQSLSTGAAGRVHVWTAHATSTGAVTLNVDGAGAKNVVDAAGTQLGSGAIVSGGVYMTVETASAHRVIGQLSLTAVSGPGSSTDNALARFDGAGGDTLQDSGIIVDDSNNVSGMGTLSSGAITSSGSVTGTTVELGGVTDTTLARASAGNVTVEGNALYRAGGTDVPVTDGGSGRSDATAYAVITGGTTSTGAHQSVSGVGTAGQVLTSNGAGQLPTWQDASGGGADAQIFTSSGTWTKPSGFAADSLVLIRLWGGGGSGARGGSGDGGGGGGGGAYVEVWKTLSDLSATETVTIGAGGAAQTSDGAGQEGGDTTFGSLVTAYGGGGGGDSTSFGGGGGGGGTLSAGVSGSGTSGGPGGEPFPGAAGDPGEPSLFGGGGGGGTADPAAGGRSLFGGGGGGGGDASGDPGGSGGDSLHGGGGGGGGAAFTGAGTGGNSISGGDGGDGGLATTPAVNGSQPGGGGGGSSNANSGAGGDGQVEVYVFPAS